MIRSNLVVIVLGVLSGFAVGEWTNHTAVSQPPQVRPERKCTACVRECGYSGLVVAQCSQRPTRFMQGCYCRSGL